MRRKALLSRAADAVFWACRYVERAENIARSVEVNWNLILDSPTRDGEQWAPLYQVTGDEAKFAAKYSRATAKNVMRFLTFDNDHPNSILSCLGAARENARTVREIISSEMWEHINSFYLRVLEASKSEKALRSPAEFYRSIRMDGHLFEGLADATMSHSEAWHFGAMGRMLERADRTSRILDVKYFLLLPKADFVGSTLDDIQWGAVLRSCSGFEMYRKEFGRLDPIHIVDFLLLNHEFPRSVLYCVGSAENSLHTITGSAAGTYRTVSEQRLGQLRSELIWADVQQIILGGLHEYLDQFQARLNQVGDGIYADFFALSGPSVQAAPEVPIS